jgi:hypothetical protein
MESQNNAPPTPAGGAHKPVPAVVVSSFEEYLEGLPHASRGPDEGFLHAMAQIRR